MFGGKEGVRALFVRGVNDTWGRLGNMKCTIVWVELGNCMH